MRKVPDKKENNHIRHEDHGEDEHEHEEEAFVAFVP